MPNPIRLKPEESILLVVDVQTRLLPAMFEAERLERNCALLATAARQLDVPIVVTEHNPSRLGSTVATVAEPIGPHQPISKMLFSACTEETRSALSVLRNSGRSSVLICGAETHVCVMQTALDLLEADFRVFIPNNAVSSRYENDKIAGLARLSASGAVASSTEMAVYEWLQDANSPAFKPLLSLIK